MKIIVAKRICLVYNRNLYKVWLFCEYTYSTFLNITRKESEFIIFKLRYIYVFLAEQQFRM